MMPQTPLLISSKQKSVEDLPRSVAMSPEEDRNADILPVSSKSAGRHAMKTCCTHSSSGCVGPMAIVCRIMHATVSLHKATLMCDYDVVGLFNTNYKV